MNPSEEIAALRAELDVALLQHDGMYSYKVKLGVWDRLTYPRHEYGASDEQERAVPERQGWTKGRPE
jgi:hypothetical protein